MLTAEDRATGLLVPCLAWTAVATVATIAIELSNGDATANLRTPADALFLLFALAPAVAGALTLRMTHNRAAGWLLVLSTTVGMTALLLHAVVVAIARTATPPPALVWPAVWLTGPAFSLLVLVPGRIRNLERRPLLEPLAVLSIAWLTAALAFGPDPLTGVGAGIAPIANPVEVPALAEISDVGIDVTPLLLLGYAGGGLVLLAWDRIARRRPTDPERRPWAVLGMVLPVTISVGIVVGAAIGRGAFAGAWVAAVLTPVVVLVAVTVLVARALATERRLAEELRRDAETRESERERVRRDLHDGIGPALAGMRLQLDVVRDRIPPGSLDAHAAADRLEESLDDTLGELRRIVDGMQPSALEDRGLRGALSELTRSMATGPTSLSRVELDVAPDLPSLPSEIELVLLRVCAEALSNAVRHAAPTICRVSLAWDGGTARLTVDDDGVGLNAASVGLGLLSMRSRVEAVGGVLAVGPCVGGRGTSVSASVPVAG